MVKKFPWGSVASYEVFEALDRDGDAVAGPIRVERLRDVPGHAHAAYDEAGREIARGDRDDVLAFVVAELGAYVSPPKGGA